MEMKHGNLFKRGPCKQREHSRYATLGKDEYKQIWIVSDPITAELGCMSVSLVD